MLALCVSCDVHEWPKEPEEPDPVKNTRNILLRFSTPLNEVQLPYDTRSTEAASGYDMRYILRAFPIIAEERSVSRTASWEYTFTRSVSTNDYDCKVEVELPEGEYSLMVWADFVKAGSNTHYFYAPDDFSEITLYGNHKANTDFRDAFRGIEAEVSSSDTEDIVVEMERPMAKFEFITTDLKEFVAKEYAKLKSSDSRSIDLSDYKLTFYYNGFMPCAYNMFTDKPNDSKTGVSFESSLVQTGDTEASMGFDYVLVNGSESKVPIVIALQDAYGKDLFVTGTIDVPLKRGQHTLMKGKFLTTNTSGGVGIVPDFNGDYNYEVK